LDKDYEHFIEQIKKIVGIDLSLYKENQMKRRLKSLYEKNGFQSFTQYAEVLATNKPLVEEFLDRMTINVTEFFRNQNRWDVLQKSIIPMLVKNNPQLKVWSAASSTGEEPYTIAMLLHHLGIKQRASILATDIDENVLQIARAGKYPPKALENVAETFVKKYFEKDAEMYAVTTELKQMIQYKLLNLLADPYPNQLDLIVCRNVLIYFTEEAKEQIYINFSKALKPGGILFVGSTEQIFNPQKYQLEVVDTFFYRKISN